MTMWVQHKIGKKFPVDKCRLEILKDHAEACNLEKTQGHSMVQEIQINWVVLENCRGPYELC